MITELAMTSLAGVFSILWYLLRQKDAKQEEEIKSLFAMHHQDVAKLNLLELEIAKNHYPKSELDIRFQQLDTTIKEGFRELSTDIKDMTRALNAHLQEHHKGGQ
jgi:hypothetical protein